MVERLASNARLRPFIVVFDAMLKDNWHHIRRTKTRLRTSRWLIMSHSRCKLVVDYSHSRKPLSIAELVWRALANRIAYNESGGSHHLLLSTG